MGREIRRVPANWEHPKDENGRYVPLFGGSYSQLAREWDDENAKWNDGLRKHGGTGEWIPLGDECRSMTFAEWSGGRPQEEDYMPDWSPDERTHYQMYEDTSEGTPISPVCNSPETLARWLVDNDASSFAGMTASYESWLRVACGGYAPSMIMQGNVLQSGVEALRDE